MCLFLGERHEVVVGEPNVADPRVFLHFPRGWKVQESSSKAEGKTQSLAISERTFIGVHVCHKPVAQADMWKIDQEYSLLFIPGTDINWPRCRSIVVICFLFPPSPASSRSLGRGLRRSINNFATSESLLYLISLRKSANLRKILGSLRFQPSS